MAEINRMEVDGNRTLADVSPNRELKEQQANRVRDYLSGQQTAQETDSGESENEEEDSNREAAGQHDSKEEEAKQYDKQRYKAVNYILT